MARRRALARARSIFLSPEAPARGGRADLDLSQPIELIVLAVKERATRCRLPGADRVISLRSSRLWDIVPGEIESARLDMAALGLTPLALKDEGEWDPKDEYWGEEASRHRAAPAGGAVMPVRWPRKR